MEPRLAFRGAHEIQKGVSWLSGLGREETQHVRDELLELLLHCRASLKSVLDVAAALELIPKDELDEQRFWSIYWHYTGVFTTPRAAENERTHCSDIAKDVRRINFKMARVLRTELSSWRGIGEAFEMLISADEDFLQTHAQEMIRVREEVDKILRDLGNGEQASAWKKYGKTEGFAR